MAKSSYLLVFLALLLASATLHVSCSRGSVFTERGAGVNHEFSGSNQVHRVTIEEHLDYQDPGANNPPPHGG